jgi:hypothetical protein
MDSDVVRRSKRGEVVGPDETRSFALDFREIDGPTDAPCPLLPERVPDAIEQHAVSVALAANDCRRMKSRRRVPRSSDAHVVWQVLVQG